MANFTRERANPPLGLKTFFKRGFWAIASLFKNESSPRTHSFSFARNLQICKFAHLRNVPILINIVEVSDSEWLFEKSISFGEKAESSDDIDCLRGQAKRVAGDGNGRMTRCSGKRATRPCVSVTNEGFCSRPHCSFPCFCFSEHTSSSQCLCLLNSDSSARIRTEFWRF